LDARSSSILHRGDAEGAELPRREVSDLVIAAAIEVHRALGPGLLESIYQKAIERELSLREVPFCAQVLVPVRYKGVELDAPLRLDLLVGGCVVVEVKSVVAPEDIHRAQLLTYLKLAEVPVGLLINFNTVVLKQGIKRVVNTPRISASSASPR
jgi:GxxExxY protein